MKKVAIALAIVFVFASFSTISISIAVDDDFITHMEQEAFEIPEKTNDGIFTENLGQWDEEIYFNGDTSFGEIGLGKGCVYFNMREIIETDKVIPGFERMDPFENIPHEIEIKGHVVKYTFEDSNDVVPIGVGPRNHVNNYFYGNDPDEWITGARNFESVVYHGLYDNIDLKYYFSEKGPKYDLVLNPGSDPEDIRVKVEGHDTLDVNDGTLNIDIGNDMVIQDRDLATYYQNDREIIKTNFRLINENSFAYSLDKYDPDETVVIDPIIFSTFVGGAAADTYSNLITDNNGDMVMIGRSASTDFPTTTGAYGQSNGGGNDIIVFKMETDGSDLIFSTYIGGDGNDISYRVTIDVSNHIYILGQTASTDFPTSVDAFDKILNGTNDAYVLKLKSDGSDLLFSTLIGSDGADSGNGAMKVLSAGEVVISIQAGDGTYPTTPGAFNRTFGGGNYDLAVTKIKNDGTDLIFSTFLGGAQAEGARLMEVDENGNFIITCFTSSFDFPTTIGSFEEEPQGGSDLTLLKLKNDGSDLIFSTFIGGTGDENGGSMLVDQSGNYIIGGTTQSANFPWKAGSYDTNIGGSEDDFVIKIKKDGSDSIFSTYIGGSGVEEFGEMSFGSDSDIIIHGATSSTDFPTSVDAFDRTLNGTDDHFIFRLKDDGTSMIRSTLIGGSQNEALQMFLDIGDNLFLAGYGNSIDYPTTINADNGTNIGGYDILFTELEYDLSGLVYSTYFGGTALDYGGMYSDPYGDIYLWGHTASTDFPTSSGVFDETHNGGNDIFISKILGGLYEEPESVDSVDIYSDQDYTIPSSSFDIGDRVYIELVGVNPDATRRDFANVNVSFGWSPINPIRVRLRETDINSDIYRGVFIVPPSTLYCDSLTISSIKDPTKTSGIFIEPPYRPISVSDVELYMDAGLTNNPENFDYNDIVYIRVTGADAHPMLENLALVNITSQKNGSFRILLTLLETGINSGVYTGIFQVPEFLEYFDNLTVYSVRSENVMDTFMLHTQVQIRPFEDVTTATEDEEYLVEYWNFGYEPSTWTMDTISPWLLWNMTSNELYGTPDNNHIGIWDVMITLDDSKGHEESREFQIEVINKDPSIMVDLVTEITEGEDYYCDFDCSDDGQGEMEWVLIGSAPWLSMETATGVLSGRPTMEDVGTFNLSVVVKDGNGGIGSLDFQVVVIGTKKPPRFDSPDITTGKQGENYYRAYSAYDPDGNVYDLVWTLETNANFLEMDEQYGVLQGTPGKYDVGVFWVIVTVTDLDNLSANHSFELTIENVNDKPEWDVIPEDSSILHGKWFYFDVNATDPDPDGFLEYTVTSDPETNITIDSNTGELEWFACIRCFETNIYDLEVNIKVADGELFVIHTFNIEVKPTQSPTSTITGPDEAGRMPSDNCIVTLGRNRSRGRGYHVRYLSP